MMRKRASIKAVWDSDLVSLLQSAGILDRLLDGDVRCVVCHKEVDLDNLGALLSDGHEIMVSCDDTQCVREATTREVVPAGG